MSEKNETLELLQDVLSDAVQGLIDRAVRDALWKAFLIRNPQPQPTEDDLAEAREWVEKHPHFRKAKAEDKAAVIAEIRHYDAFRATDEYRAIIRPEGKPLSLDDWIRDNIPRTATQTKAR
ncbi:hypothetical protein [Streptomyces europaeiscabiei]|uniref:hypothetical protein n=1 Tax=Streptomyces europaeiscabiei TaxID=146819 RepID=UPI0029A4E352|nr:hypothetical protein [Streptomyces europaeiscabiei]MDX3666966.1 hypothetical protein [Streptomyces europaeiscabiei]